MGFRGFGHGAGRLHFREAAGRAIASHRRGNWGDVGADYPVVLPVGTTGYGSGVGKVMGNCVDGLDGFHPVEVFEGQDAHDAQTRDGEDVPLWMREDDRGARRIGVRANSRFHRNDGWGILLTWQTVFFRD